MAITQIYAAATDGATYNDVPPNAVGSGSKSNGGAVTRGGTVSAEKLVNVNVHRYDFGVFGSTVLDNSSANKALSLGTFAYNRQRPIAKRTTSSLSGVNNVVLVSGASQPNLVQSIHKLNVLRTRKFTTAIRANKYNRFTNTWEAGYPVVQVDALNTDTAATPTRTNPGRLVYKLGQASPVTGSYKPKTA
jgi:hypothetical protein